MKKYIYLYIGSALLSLIFISLLMIFIFDKPLIVGWGKTAYNVKHAHYAESNKQNNIIIVAGSNGLFSHSCETIERILNKNCTNYSVSVGLGLDFILEKSKEVISKNTIVILPLEVELYNGTKEASIKSNGGNLHIIENDHKYIFQFGFKRALYILFSKDFKYIVGSILENILDKVGFKRRFNVNTLNENGDMIKHNESKSIQYKAYVHSQNAPRPTIDVCKDSYNSKIIKNYIKYVNSFGGEVFGSYPTTFETKLTNSQIKSYECIKNLYESNEAYFINLDNKSMYPKDSFYDTIYHLNEETQIKHSLKIAEFIKQNQNY